MSQDGTDGLNSNSCSNVMHLISVYIPILALVQVRLLTLTPSSKLQGTLEHLAISAWQLLMRGTGCKDAARASPMFSPKLQGTLKHLAVFSKLWQKNQTNVTSKKLNSTQSSLMLDRHLRLKLKRSGSK